LQDLKTGQLVDATPWRQQVALVIGVVMGALVIPPVLDLLNAGYGFSGAPNLHPGSNPLPAPQAALITALASGVVGGKLNWGMLGIGALVGVAIVAIDEALRAKGKLRLPPLAVALGIYLPAATTAPVAFGALLGMAYDRWAAGTPNPPASKQLGVLLASGLIVGESLCGVLFAGIIVLSGNPWPIAVVGDAFAPASNLIGAIAFLAVSFGIYRWIRRLSANGAG
jgi:putative OPT family oligopeptide transporter